MRPCEDCTGSGITVTWRWSDEAQKKMARIDDCIRCDGVGRRHECDRHYCLTKRSWTR